MSYEHYRCFDQHFESPSSTLYEVARPDSIDDDPIEALRASLLGREPLNLDPSVIESGIDNNRLPSFTDLGTSPASAFGIDRIDAAILSHSDAAVVAYSSAAAADEMTTELLGGREADSDPRPDSDPDAALSRNSEDSPTLQKPGV